jgi:CRISPR-associated protein Csx3
MNDDFPTLPALMLGGPPHAGKSVLLYHLTHALHTRNIPHYALRACPDGEGNWANEADQALVQEIRHKGQFTNEFIALVARDLQQRILPLLVDIGGHPTEKDTPLFHACTHGIILYHELPDLERWRALMASNGLVIIAELHSDLRGVDKLESTGGVLRGTLSGLERGQMIQSFVLDALLERIIALFAPYAEAARRQHLGALHSEPNWHVLALNELRTALGLDGHEWHWTELARATRHVQTMLSPGTGLALYGRGPAWLYAALAAAIAPEHSLRQFDANGLSWISPLAIQTGRVVTIPGLNAVAISSTNVTVLHFTGGTRLNYHVLGTAEVPVIPAPHGLILDGPMPLWLVTSLVQAYIGQVPWIAVAEPRLGRQAIVVWSATESPAIGSICPVPAVISTGNNM